MGLQNSGRRRTEKSERTLRLGAVALGLGPFLGALGGACISPSDALDLRPGGAHPSVDGGAPSTVDASKGETGIAPDDGDGGYGPLDGATAIALAEKLFRAIPDFGGGCGGANGSCHVNGTSVGMPPPWLAGPDTYKTIKTYDSKQSGILKFIVPDPTGSRLFTKGNHSGQPLDPTSTLGIAVKKWLDVEAAALVSATLPSSAPVSVVTATNVAVDLSAAGMGIAGAKITFDATVTGTLLSMTNLKLVAPASSGLHVLHPVFVQVPATGKPIEDPADNFSNVDQTTGPGTSAQLGDGLVILTGLKWAAGDKLRIEFTKAEVGTATSGDAGGAGGCKNVAGFQTLAPYFMGGNGITPNCTAACHKSGGGGDGALDLNGLVLATPDYKAACNQALTRVNLADKAKSDLILHPTGQMGNHQGGTLSNVAAYTTAVTTWLSGE